MKRIHIHIAVPELASAIHFYNNLFGVKPDKIKEDYAKWQLEDPKVNFAISTRSKHYGLDHLGLQVDDEEELAQISERLQAADIDAGKTDATTCCYAESVKSWSFDTAGIAWEKFVTMADAEVYGTDSTEAARDESCCSGEAPTQGANCC